MNKYVDSYGSTYIIHETSFVNPANRNETLLFVLTNESDAVLAVSTTSWDVKSWVQSFGLTAVSQ